MFSSLAIRILIINREAMDEAEAMPHRLTIDEEAAVPAFVDAVVWHQSFVFSIAYHLLS